MTKQTLLDRIDDMDTFRDKLEYLNKMFLLADSPEIEEVILDMVSDLKNWGC